MPPAIRIATIDDVQGVLDVYSPYCATPTSFEIGPPTPGEMRVRMETVLERLPWLVCDLGDEVAGFAYASPHRERAAYRWSVDVSVYVRRERTRRGIGRALYTSLFEILTRQGLRNAFAGIALPNPGSVGLHEAMGFRSIGVYRNVGYKCDAWHDVGWYQLVLQPVAQPPNDPLFLRDALAADWWESALTKGQSQLRTVDA